MTDHPITPPPELIQKWWDGTHGAFYEFEAVTTQAARWGADQELEACCAWVQGYAGCGDSLRAARRPKPKSLAEKALEAAQRFYANGHDDCSENEVKDDFDIIRRALERLQELEGKE